VAGAVKLISKISASVQKKLRAQRRVIFCRIRLLIALAISSAIHFKIYDFSIDNHNSRSLYQNQSKKDHHINIKLSENSSKNKNGANLTANKKKSILQDSYRSSISPERKILIPLPERIYYPRNELTKPPKLIQDVDLSPLKSIIKNETKTVNIDIFISKEGIIDKIFVEPEKLNKIAEIELKNIIKNLKFSNGEIDDKPVNSHLKIEIVIISTSEPQDTKKSEIPTNVQPPD